MLSVLIKYIILGVISLRVSMKSLCWVSLMLSVSIKSLMLGVTGLNISIKCIMPGVIMLSFSIQSVMLGVIMLMTTAARNEMKFDDSKNVDKFSNFTV